MFTCFQFRLTIGTPEMIGLLCAQLDYRGKIPSYFGEPRIWVSHVKCFTHILRGWDVGYVMASGFSLYWILTTSSDDLVYMCSSNCWSFTHLNGEHAYNYYLFTCRKTVNLCTITETKPSELKMETRYKVNQVKKLCMCFATFYDYDFNFCKSLYVLWVLVTYS